MKKQGRMILKCITGCLVVMLPFFVIWGYIFLFPQNYMDDQWDYAKWNRDICTSPDVNAKVLILGDSLPNSCLIPEELSDDTYNLSMGGTSILEGRLALEEYLAHHDTAPETVYISYYDDHMETDSSYREITMYYHRFPLKTEYELTKTFSRTTNNSMSRTDAALMLFQYHFAFPSLYMTSLMDGGIAGRIDDNKNTYAALEETRGRYCISDEIISDTTEYYHNNYIVDPVINEELRKTIELCIQNDIQVRIVLPPKAPNILYNQSYLDEINGYYETLMNDYPGITCDIHPDMGLVMENYADYVHFNNSGAKIVTNYVKERYPEDF